MKRFLAVFACITASLIGGVLAQSIGGGVVQKVFAGVFFGGPLSLSSTASQPSLGLWLNETFSGSCTGQCGGNLLQVASDTTAVPVGALGDALQLTYSFGGAGMTGNRTGISINNTLTATTSNANGSFPAYAGISAQTVASAGDNGTGLTALTANGQSTGANFIGTLNAPATNFWRLGGAEFNTNARAGSSTYRKVGIQIAQLSTDAVQGSVDDAAILLGNQNGAVGWNTGFQIGFDSAQSTGAFPLAAAATVLGFGTNASGRTITNGINLIGPTYSGAPFLAPQMTPASQTATCTVGAIEWDASQIYVCTSASHWKRAALSDTPF